MPNHVTNRVVVSGPIEDVAAFKKLMVVNDKESTIDFGTSSGTYVGLTFDFNGAIPMPEILKANDGIAVNDAVIMTKIASGVSMAEALKAEPAPPFLFVQWAWSRYLEEVRAAGLDTSSDTVVAQNYLKLHPDIEEQGRNELAKIAQTGYANWHDWSITNWGTKWNAYDYEPVEDHARFEFTINTAWCAPTPVYDQLAKQFPDLTLNLAWYDEGGMHAGQGIMSRFDASQSEDFYTEPNDKIFERVYGVAPVTDEQLNDEWIDQIGLEPALRLGDNLTCPDVGAAMDSQGFFPLNSVTYSDDPTMEDFDYGLVRELRPRILQRLGLTA
jgi:hypothetical protein